MKKRQLFLYVFTVDHSSYMLLQVNKKSKSTLFALIHMPGLMGMIQQCTISSPQKAESTSLQKAQVKKYSVFYKADTFDQYLHSTNHSVP